MSTVMSVVLKLQLLVYRYSNHLRNIIRESFIVQITSCRHSPPYNRHAKNNSHDHYHISVDLLNNFPIDRPSTYPAVLSVLSKFAASLQYPWISSSFGRSFVGKLVAALQRPLALEERTYLNLTIELWVQKPCSLAASLKSFYTPATTSIPFEMVQNYATINSQ